MFYFAVFHIYFSKYIINIGAISCFEPTTLTGRQGCFHYTTSFRITMVEDRLSLEFYSTFLYPWNTLRVESLKNPHISLSPQINPRRKTAFSCKNLPHKNSRQNSTLSKIWVSKPPGGQLCARTYQLWNRVAIIACILCILNQYYFH